MAIKVNENKILNLLERTEKRIRKVLKSNYYLDDAMWGDDIFSVCVMEDLGSPQNQVCAYRLIFAYDETDYLERNVNQQYGDWFVEKFMILEEMGVIEDGQN